MQSLLLSPWALPPARSACARFDDEVVALKEAGVHAAYNFFEEAGAGLAEAAYEKLDAQMEGNT